MERQYTRLDDARELIDPILKAISDEEIKRCAYVHLYGVGLMASLIALRRGYRFDEILKDADAAQHSLRNPMEDFYFRN